MNKRALFFISLFIFVVCGCSPSEEEQEAAKLRRMVHLEEESLDSDQVAEN